MDAKMKREAREAARLSLSSAIRALLGILQGKLSKDDPRWQQFGLNIPAAKTTPARPQNVNAYWNVEGLLRVSCDAVPLTTRYRWRARVAGIEVAFRRVASTKDPAAAIADLPAGFDMELYVQAANSDTQSVPSALVVIPAMRAKLAPVAMVQPMPTFVSEPAAETVENEQAPAPHVALRNGNGNHVPARA